MGFNFGVGRKLTQGVRFVKCAECGRNGRPLEPGGIGKQGILIVTEMATKEQVEEQSWFVSRQNTSVTLCSDFGLNLPEDTWFTAVLPCAGPARMKTFLYDHCLLKLKETVDALKPVLIISVGAGATGAVLKLYKPSHFPLNYSSQQYAGYCLPLSAEPGWDCWLAPVQSDRELNMYRNGDVIDVACGWQRKHLKWALEQAKKGRPGPLFSDEGIEIIFDTDRIVAALEQARGCKYAAFDYECNALQMLMPGAKVLTAAVAMGDSAQIHRTVAFPMASGNVRRAWVDFLKSDVLKIAQNIKYEEHVSLVHFNTPVVNWAVDSAVLARTLDCQPGNSGLKFQALVHYGVVGYDDVVDKYISSTGNGGLNRLEQLAPGELMLYNGIDALITYMLARDLSKIIGLGF